MAAYWTTPYFPFLGRVWPTDYRTITQHYGARKKYYSKFGLPDGHEGTDFRAPTGTPVYAIDHGRVKSTHLNPKPKSQGGHNYGLHIRIAHSNAYESISAHLDTIYVRPGELVRPAQMIGRAGNTGNSFGAHLHLTIKHYGRYTNPEPILQNAPLAKDYP